MVDEAYQAEFIEDLLSFWPTVNGAERPEGPVYIYTTRDFLTGDPNAQYNFGVFKTDWTPKLAAYIIAQYAGGLVEAPPEQDPDRPIIDAAIAVARAIRRRDGARDQRRLRTVQSRCRYHCSGDPRVD